MNATLHQLLLATEGAEGLSGDHIASKLAVPIAIVVFCGSVFLLLWSNYGAKKGALIYGVAAGGFCTMIGVFWWFGAPGTPVATGLQNFPGQTADAYTAKWYPFEPGSERASYFNQSDLTNFVTVEESLGVADASVEELESDPKYGAVQGDANGAGQLMVSLLLREEGGSVGIGGNARAEYGEAGLAGLAAEGIDAADVIQAEPFYTAEIDDNGVLITRDGDTLLAGANVQVFVNYETKADGELISIQVDEQPMFAFKQESNLWFPSAVWTGLWFLVFLGSLTALDRIEQREKKTQDEVQEPERLAVPVRQ